MDNEEKATPEQGQNVYIARISSLVNAPFKTNSRPSPLIRTKLKETDLVGEDADKDKAKAMVGKDASSSKHATNPLTHSKITEDKVEQGFSSKRPSPVKSSNGNLKLASSVTTAKVQKQKNVEIKKKNQVTPSTSKAASTRTEARAQTGASRNKLPARTPATTHATVKSKQIALTQKKKIADQPRSNNKSVPAAIVKDKSKSPKTLESNISIEHANDKDQPTDTHTTSPTETTDDKIVQITHGQPETIEVSDAKPELENDQAAETVELSSNEKRTKYFKSKFWDMDENKKSEPRVPKREKDEAHSKEIQSYIEKRREMLQMKLKKDAEDRQFAQDQRKLKLDELKAKCRVIVSTSKQLPTKPLPPSSTEKQPLKPFRNKQSLSPLKARRTIQMKSPNSLQGVKKSTKTTDSVEIEEIKPKRGIDLIDLRTSTLLREFENIVKQECMNILRVHKPSKSPSKDASSTVDAAVETKISLVEIKNQFDKHYKEPLPHFETPSRRRTTMFANLTQDASDVEQPNIVTVSEEVKQKAAAKIQAAFKGYKVRKVLKEANLLPSRRKLNKIKKREWPFATGLMTFSNFQEVISRPTAPKKSSDWDFPYIPPPEQHSFGSPRSKSKGLPVTSLSHIELSRFQEPFPKEALRRLSAIHNSPRPKTYERRYSDSAFNFPKVTPRKSDLDIDVTDSPRIKPSEEVPATRFSTVLLEKVRLLEEKATMMTRSQEKKPSPSRSKKPLRESQHHNESTQDESVSATLESENVSQTNTITEEYIGPDEKKMKEAHKPRTGPKSLESKSPKKSKTTRKKKLMYPVKQTKSGSTTTVDTDVELQSEQMESKQEEKLPQSVSKGDGAVVPSSSLGIDEYPTPALKLQFQAEKERLHILGEALKATLAAETDNLEERRRKYEAQSPEKDVETNKINNANASLNGSHDYIIQLAKCQADCLKATAEVTKWMTELRKAEKEREIVQRDQQTVNMAAVVFAAVEEAKRISGFQSISIPQEKQDRQVVQQQPDKVDEFTQFPSERSELIQKLDHELELTPIKLDKSSSASSTSESEAVTFMTEKSSIGAEKPDSFIQTSHDKNENLENLTYGEEEFEEPEESSVGLGISEDLNLRSNVSERVSIAESEHFVPDVEKPGETVFTVLKTGKEELPAEEMNNETFTVEEVKEVSPSLRPKLDEHGNEQDEELDEEKENDNSIRIEPISYEQEIEEIIRQLKPPPTYASPPPEQSFHIEQFKATSKSSDTSSESEALTFMTEKSSIGAEKPDSFIQTSHDKNENLENLTYGEEEFEEPEESNGGISEDLNLSSNVSERLSIAESEHFVPDVEKPGETVLETGKEELPAEINNETSTVEEAKEVSPTLPSKRDDNGNELEEEVDEEKENHYSSRIELTSYDSSEQEGQELEEIKRHVKPPPTYSSPPPEQSFHVEQLKASCKEWQLRDMIQQHIDYIWDSWITSKSFPADYEDFAGKFSPDPEDKSIQTSEHVLEVLVSDTICEVIQEVLDIALNPRFEKSFLDKIRPGPLAIKAQKLRLPQTKEKLMQLIYDEVLNLMPSNMVICKDGTTPQRKSWGKWICTHCHECDLADRALIQEMIKEDQTWINCWPEEVIEQDRLAENMIKRFITEVTNSFAVALQ